MKKCNDKNAWKGQCCCNCKYQASITKHPWNITPEFKGIYSEHLVYGCAVFFVLHQINKFEGYQNSGDLGKINISEDKHGMCELWEGRK